MVQKFFCHFSNLRQVVFFVLIVGLTVFGVKLQSLICVDIGFLDVHRETVNSISAVGKESVKRPIPQVPFILSQMTLNSYTQYAVREHTCILYGRKRNKKKGDLNLATSKQSFVLAPLIARSVARRLVVVDQYPLTGQPTVRA